MNFGLPIANFGFTYSDDSLDPRLPAVRALYHPIFFIIAAAAISASAQMVTLPGGSFTMGGRGGEKDEQPQHTVTVTAFSIDKYETSYAQYDSCVQKGVCTPPHFSDGKCLMWTSHGLRRVTVPPAYRIRENPVVCVSWHQARAYCRYKGKRLPTEAQWEYAALAGGRKKYSWGSNRPDPSKCTHPQNRKPKKSGSFASNSRALYDMTGNVWEWTADRYEHNYYSYSEQDNPKGPSVGRYRTIRGGGWYSTEQQLRIKNRQWFVPEYGEVSIGIRCVK